MKLNRTVDERADRVAQPFTHIFWPGSQVHIHGGDETPSSSKHMGARPGGLCKEKLAGREGQGLKELKWWR
jgi:hypothetical protein